MEFTPALREEYRNLFRTAKVRPERRAVVKSIVSRLVASKPRYESAGSPIGVPWWTVAVIHELEASQDFNTHLHNGDPLTGKTVHVPAGRPPGTPPFTWEASARDALSFDHLAGVTDWSISHALFLLEGFNGTGYRSRGINTPYLWSFSQHYDRGKFGSDGHFDPNLVSQQAGAGVLLRVMVNDGLVSPGSAGTTTAPGVPFPGRILKLTTPLMTGGDVRAYQERMQARGLGVAVDSFYGQQCKTLTEGFQRDHGLAVDGQVGEMTWNAAFAA